ncbi:MAG: biotin carboxylase N-terminal domain-containing protein [Pseudomonadota bacterium]
MFTKILIANRGEIACRVIETCRRLGVRTVAVHSDVDAGARHVAMADEAVSLGGAAPAESYLKGDAIIAAMQATGAKAVHPGYGFLSENPDFVEAVEAAGLTFIGPSAKAIRAMGLKDAAKALMAEAGVPVVPGYQGEDQAPDRLAREAEAIGYPVLIKAVAGGGGKGMRRVEGPGDFAEALEAAVSEAEKAFGNGHVLIEKWVSTPRHIEVQVFGDGTRAVHLFERDCSLQRRHQKVIEEAPAPGMTAEMRDAMGAAAVRAAEAIGYAGAGTVEFIVDASEGLRPDRFYFMEMNTRLQVEHPVTEAITGVDLVEWQLRVAWGEALWMDQGDLSITGHSFEARLYAEDAAAGFLPATGTLTHLAFPDGVRAETGVRAGDVISPWYDPMIAKLVVHGPTRGAALGALERALAGTQVAGTVTNLAFLRRLARHDGFGRGQVDTGLIDREVAALTALPVACTRTRALAAILALGLDEAVPGQGFHLWAPLTWSVTLQHRGEEIAARVTAEGDGHFAVDLGDGPLAVSRVAAGWVVDGRPVAAAWHRDPGRLTVFWGNAYPFDLRDPLEVAAGDAAASGVIEAPMPGLVKAVSVAAGQDVSAGDRLAVLEAMKMEHVLRAPRDGRVAEVLAAEGAQVEAGAALVRMEEEAA